MSEKRKIVSVDSQLPWPKNLKNFAESIATLLLTDEYGKVHDGLRFSGNLFSGYNQKTLAGNLHRMFQAANVALTIRRK